MHRRRFLLAGLAALPVHAEAVQWPSVLPGRRLAFPADHGAHPEFRTEWWYVTGWLRTADGRDLGVQITFFRNRPGVQEGTRSRFAPSQLLFAHAALADLAAGRLLHDERSAREGFGLAGASTLTTDVRIDDWQLTLEGSTYRARTAGREFGLDLAFTATTPILVQGDAGLSRKGPAPGQASYYYSRPHLQVSGRVLRDKASVAVTGTAWLDHEWSSEILGPEATGWDWCGINLHDGGALMAFNIRDGAGGAIWAGGSRRTPDGRTRIAGPEGVHFEVVRHWTSPRTGSRYPVSMRIALWDEAITLEPLLDDQELDARGSTGTLYWEGAVRAFRGQFEVGRGYLELTGYGQRLKL
jgi:predicted secreted hydrolase